MSAYIAQVFVFAVMAIALLATVGVGSAGVIVLWWGNAKVRHYGTRTIQYATAGALGAGLVGSLCLLHLV